MVLSACRWRHLACWYPDRRSSSNCHRGAAGIGAAVARRLVRAGAEVLIADADRVWGGLDILVNNAGGVWRPTTPTPNPSTGRVIDLNLRAVMLATQLALRRMEPRGGGAVVNIASTGGLLEGGYDKPEYGAAKAGAMRFTDALAPLKDQGTPSSRADHAGMSPAERANLPPALSADQIADLTPDLIADESRTGSVLLYRANQPLTPSAIPDRCRALPNPRRSVPRPAHLRASRGALRGR